MEWYEVKNSDEVDTPALIIYPERVKKNLGTVKTFIDDIARLRPHIKTSKCAQVLRLMLEAGITKFKCATIAEAEMLASLEAPDVLLAYQPLGPKAQRFCAVQERYPQTKFSCLVDNAPTADALSAAATDRNQIIRVFIDLNVGMNRTGIRPGAEAFQLFKKASSAKGLAFMGLHAYDGHIREADLGERTKICDAAFQGVEELVKQIATECGKAPLVVAGGTPTFPIHAKRPGVECSPGTFIFWDKGYQQSLPEQPFEIAALVATRVISKPDKDTLCVDLGHKSVAAENPLQQRVYFLNAPGLTPVGHSEEHMVWRTDGKHQYEVGDLFYGVPHHICPTVALYEEAAVCREHEARERWPIVARKRKIHL